MDRSYIQNEHIVDRYLSGELTVREAREFEMFCLHHPDFLNALPIPVRLKARLARRPLEDSETGMFPALPSTATRTALAAGEEGFDADEEQREWRRSSGAGGPGRWLTMALVLGLLAAIGGMVVFGRQVNALSTKIATLQRVAATRQLQAPGSVAPLHLQLSRVRPTVATTTIGWPLPPQLLDISIDATEAKYSTFQITIDRIDGSRLLQLQRMARDSNRALRFKLNSSAFGPGEYLLKFDGYTWRGDPEEIGWLRLDMQ